MPVVLYIKLYKVSQQIFSSCWLWLMRTNFYCVVLKSFWWRTNVHV